MSENFIGYYYVCADLTPSTPKNIQMFEQLNEAIEAYNGLPNNQVKALGVQNTAPQPGSLDFVQCHNGKNVLIRDYEKLSAWRNPEILRLVNQLRDSMPLEEQRILRFITPEYDDLFTIKDGESIRLRYHDGSIRIMPCRAYPDGYHFELGRGDTFHICEFAELCRNRGILYEPATKDSGMAVDTYDVYQIRNTRETGYAFQGYACAQESLNPNDYKLVYSGMLGKRLSLERLFYLHNMDERPLASGMRSMSMSDVVVLHQDGKDAAYYVDTVGFEALPDAFCKGLEPRACIAEKSMPER